LSCGQQKRIGFVTKEECWCIGPFVSGKGWKEEEHKNWKFVKSWGGGCYIINPAA
jgi:hypothetical protein